MASKHDPAGNATAAALVDDMPLRDPMPVVSIGLGSLASLASVHDVVFERPLALWALAVALPVLLAHLYRKRRKRVAVAFVPLLREAVGPVRARGAWKRLREAVRLVLRVGAVAALALALAGPRPASASTPVEDLMIVIDADETTSCRESAGGPLAGATRADREVALASAHVRAHPEGRVGVVLAGPTPEAIAAPSDDRDAVLRAIAEHGIEALAGHADLSAAVAVARAAKAKDRALRVLVISSRELPSDATGRDVTVEGAGTAQDDQGFVDASLSTGPDGGHAAVRVVVRNVADERRTRRVDAIRRSATPAAEGVPSRAHGASSPVGSPIATKTVDVPARGEVEVSFDLGDVADEFVRVELSDADGKADAWDSNDVVGLFVGKPRRPSVLVVHGGAPRPFLRALLEAMGEAIDRDATGFVAVEKLSAARPRDVVIFDGVAPPAGAATPAATIYLAPFPADAGDRLPFRAGREVKEPLVWRSETTDPLLRGVDLSTAYVARATTIVARDAKTLASVEGDAVVAEGGPGDARWLAFGLDPDGSDLPIRAALPVLLANAIRRMGQLPLAPLKPFYRAGEPLVPRVDLGAAWISATYVGRAGMSSRTTAALVERGARSPFDLVDLPRIGVNRLVGGGNLAAWGPSSSPSVFAPSGGPFEVSATRVREGTTVLRTAVDTLDRGYDIRPVRPPSPPPPPAPPRAKDEAATWLRWLLLAAAVLLALDLLLGAIGRRFVGAAAGVA